MTQWKMGTEQKTHLFPVRSKCPILKIWTGNYKNGNPNVEQLYKAVFSLTKIQRNAK